MLYLDIIDIIIIITKRKRRFFLFNVIQIIVSNTFKCKNNNNRIFKINLHAFLFLLLSADLITHADEFYPLEDSDSPSYADQSA